MSRLNYDIIYVLLIVAQLADTYIANSHLKLVSEDWYLRSIPAAIIANRCAASSAMMLSFANSAQLPHLFHIPEERFLAVFAHIAFVPLRVFASLGLHVPENNFAVLWAWYELATQWHIVNWVDSILVALKIIGDSFLSSYIPTGRKKFQLI